VSSAIVVGSGPNGLACAAVLAKRGVVVTVIEAEDRIGGGTRSSELTVPGLLHDECAATHPMAVSAPATLELELERYGLEWGWPEVDLAHPLDDGRGATMLRSLEATAAGLGEAGARWRQIFGPPSRGYQPLTEDIYRPFAHVPRHPLRLLRFGLPAAAPATLLARALGTPEAAALFGGVAAHAFAPLNRPLSSSIGMALICSGHADGWPVAKGGTVAIANAFAAVIGEHGGRIETGRRVRSLAELPAADAVVLDLSPRGVLELAGDRLPPRSARAYRRYKHGPGAFKLDLAVEGGVPWAYEPARRAATVHVCGSFEEIVFAEREVNRGRMPERPYVLLAQQYRSGPTPTSPAAIAATPPTRSSTSSSASPPASASASSPPPSAPPPKSRPPMPTSSAATSSPAPTPRCRRCCVPASAPTPTRPASPASSSAPLPPRPAPAPTASTASTPPRRSPERSNRRPRSAAAAAPESVRSSRLPTAARSGPPAPPPA
jgi:phytoene dehydrogenase-like protein